MKGKIHDKDNKRRPFPREAVMAQFLEGGTLNGLMGKFDRLLTAARQRQMFIPISCSEIFFPPYLADMMPLQ